MVSSSLSCLGRRKGKRMWRTSKDTRRHKNWVFFLRGSKQRASSQQRKINQVGLFCTRKAATRVDK